MFAACPFLLPRSYQPGDCRTQRYAHNVIRAGVDARCTRLSSAAPRPAPRGRSPLSGPATRKVGLDEVARHVLDARAGRAARKGKNVLTLPAPTE